MVRLDSRSGSGELAPLFAPYGVRPNLENLPFGDIEFLGNGPHGECMVGIERKRISDLIQSMQSKRLSGHQLPGMAERFDYCYLVVEGIFRPGQEGSLEILTGKTWSPGPRGGMSYRAIDAYLTTLEVKCGLIYRRTATDHETVAVIMNLYHWWRDKAWADHKAHEAVYAPADPVVGRRFFYGRRDISLVEKVAMQLPGVDSKGKAVAKRFSSVVEMVNADAKTWCEIDGIGKLGAKKIVEAIHK